MQLECQFVRTSTFIGTVFAFQGIWSRKISQGRPLPLALALLMIIGLVGHWQYVYQRELGTADMNLVKSLTSDAVSAVDFGLQYVKILSPAVR